MEASEVIIGGGSFVEGSRIASWPFSAAEKESSTPEYEDCEANWNGKQQTDQHTDQDRRVSFRSRSIQVQTTEFSMG